MKTDKDSSLNFGIVGCGHVSINNHIPVILGTENNFIKWVYDKNQDTLNEVSKLFKIKKNNVLSNENINCLWLQFLC